MRLTTRKAYSYRTKRANNLRRALLRELDRLGDSGGLTGRLARSVWGEGTPASWATTRCRTLALHGLARRHPDNAERWYITEAGRSALARSHGGEDV